MRGEDGGVPYGKRLAVDCEIYNDLTIPEMDLKRLFYYDVVERKLFIFKSVEDRVRVELELLTMFLKGGGQLWMLDIL